MSSITAEADLREKLANFETALETPLVPGEFERWIAHVREAFEELDQLLPKHIHRDHRAQLKEIAEEDKEMFARIETLKHDDEHTLERLAWFREWLPRLVDRTAQTEPHEKKLEDEIAELTQQGLDLIIHVRKQELAYTTWLSEALNRDRGTGD